MRNWYFVPIEVAGCCRTEQGATGTGLCQSGHLAAMQNACRLLGDSTVWSGCWLIAVRNHSGACCGRRHETDQAAGSAIAMPACQPALIRSRSLVEHLLGRQPRSPKAFSALAGFVEPGETIEEAVCPPKFEERACAMSNTSPPVP
jgi:hypothetical protein